MALDFFAAQEDARRSSSRLLALFALAVIVIVIAANLVVYFISLAFTRGMQDAAGSAGYSLSQFLWVGFIVAGLICLMSYLKTADLAKGGQAVAEHVGGRLLSHHGYNLQKRRLLNIVEEMAIASGVPVPPVYLIPEKGINAFAAGYTPGDAVIGVTQGALDNLDRAQLQGVIAHEFSHILNGDMRLNIRLIGVVSGLEFISDMGSSFIGPRELVRDEYGREHRSDSRPGQFVVLGFALLAVGSIGRLAGSLIKAAVSREREYLADASAIQFTRDNNGIRDALRRIGGYSGGSRLSNPASHELSHALFSEGVRFRMARLTSTHPPLDERIRRIDPSWYGGYMISKPKGQEEASPEEVALGFVSNGELGEAEMIAPDATLLAQIAGQEPPALTPSAQPVALDAEAVMEDIGQPDAGQLDTARRVLGAIPGILKDAVHEPYSARAVVYGLLLEDEDELREKQLDALKSHADMFVFRRVRDLHEALVLVSDEARLPLLEMALPALRGLSAEQYARFRENINRLIGVDDRIGLSEWATRKYVTHHLEAAFEGRHAASRFDDIRKLHEECATLLSVLAFAGRQEGISSGDAFKSGADALEMDISILGRKSLGLGLLNDAVDRLALLRPLQKPKLLKACIATIKADGRVTVVEGELLRIVADVLDCPMPPLVKG